MGIERYRTIVKLEDIRTLFENGEYEAAKAVADSIRKERLKDSSDLFLLAALYRKCGEYAPAREFLLRIYEKKVTWHVLEELMEVCLAAKKPQEAGRYLKEYCRISNGDPRNYIYEYRIGRQMHRPDEELLPILQTLKAEEYMEKYGYELAKLYHKLGREQECMAECAELILWFGEGTYVERAKALQAYYRGELSVEDIRINGGYRSREAQEQEEQEAAWRRAQEEELRRFEEEERRAAEKAWNRRAEATENQGGSIWGEPEDTEFFRRSGSVQEAWEEAAAADMGEAVWEPDGVSGAAEQGTGPAWGEAELYGQMSLFAPQEQPEEREKDTGAPAGPALMPESEFESESEPEPEPEPEPEEEGREELTEISAGVSAALSAAGIVFEEALHEFAYVERVRKQLIRMLEVVITGRKRCQCLVITGEKQSGKTTLGTYLVRLFYALSYAKSPRVAKIGAQKLNRIRISEKQEQLRDCCLVIEEAGALSEETAGELLEFISRAGGPGAVILEDDAAAMNALLRSYGEYNRMFNNRLHLPKYSNGELLCFALEYIGRHDYGISREAKKILKKKIEDTARTGQKEERLAETMKLVKTAIENADYRNQGTILAMAAAGNLLAAGAMELAAEDFGVIQ